MHNSIDSEFKNGNSCFIGIDIGKTKIAVGSVSIHGELSAYLQQTTDMEIGGQSILNQCLQMTREIMVQFSVLPLAIGIGSPGIVDHSRGIIIKSNAIPNWENIHIRTIFEKEFGIPVAVDNDVYAVALAEHLFGAARNVSLAAHLVIGTSVGLAITTSGRILRGTHGLAGQIAYLPILDSKYTLSEVLGGRGISARAQKVTGFSYTTADIFHLAREGELFAQSIVNDAVNSAALSLAWVQQLIDPDIFVLGGGVAVAEKELLQEIHKKMQVILEQYTMYLPRGIALVPAALGNHSGVIGAAALSFDKACFGGE